MSEMNTVAIVNEFKDDLPEDERRIKEKIVELIRTTVKASVGAEVPVGMEPTTYYDALRGAPVDAVPVELDIDHGKSIDDRLSDAAEILFQSYD